MDMVTDMRAAVPASEALLLARIEQMRESVRGHKQRALALWNACIPAENVPTSRVTHGKFTQQLVHSE